MRIDLLALQIAVIFLPGILWASLDAAYGARVKLSQGVFALRALVFGLTIYAIEFIVFSLRGRAFVVADLGDADKREVIGSAALSEILWGFPIAVFLAIGWLYSARFKLISRFLLWIKATKRYGDEDVWDFTFNSGDIATEYVYFRDFQNRFVYAGWVRAFSETDRVRELVLSDVKVYDFDGAFLYDIPRLYLARPPDAIHIEFPYRRSGKEVPDGGRPAND